MSQQRSPLTDSGGPKRRLSFTQLNLFLRCPRAYQYRYIDGIRTPPTSALVLGRVWHQALELNYRQKIRTGEDLPLQEMEDDFIDRFDRALGAEEMILGPLERPGKLKDLGVAMVRVHHRDIAPTVRPMLVEERFEMSLGDDFPFVFVGIWDLVEQDGTIVDHKSFKKLPSREELDRDLQLTAYAVGYRATKRTTETGLRLDVVLKSATPKAVQLSTHRTDADCRWFLDLVERVGQAIHEELFFPNPTGQYCGPMFCDHWHRCMTEGGLSS